MNEQRAIRLCLKHRDPAGFEHLVKQYRREAYYHAVALLGNPEDAADACQESFRRAFAAIPKLARLDRFYPWFYRILRNCCLNMLQRRRTASDYARDAAARGRQDAGVAVDPAVLLVRQEEQRAVWRTLGQLSAEHREILTLKYILGRSYEEISHGLGIPRGTVMSRLFHARQEFRKRFVEPPNTNPQPKLEVRS